MNFQNSFQAFVNEDEGSDVHNEGYEDTGNDRGDTGHRDREHNRDADSRRFIKDKTNIAGTQDSGYI
ncbi:unnamed protein product [Rotaria sp. Silwood2]|nr:unnamed protein product [Rotaria sp. Silwood2]CAF2668007.1 unnamed protein product [Rotaria sp. Silwood2]CAF3158799.1 unnamed protein product [Rotaria sp. Silwood2]CAF3616629.1 unnamed protein product [Rotaria sp. Silwood2]CAF4030485.1 unnamed protein product [Rotaria sp. Silwood2]